MKNPILSKKFAWIFLAVLVFIDSFLDVIRGAEGNSLWMPIVNAIGIKNVLFLVPFVLLFFYLIIKGIGWLVKKIDKTTNSEELVLTALVIVYAVFDIWLISVDFLGFKLISDFHYMIIPLTIIGLAYALWAQRKLKK